MRLEIYQFRRKKTFLSDIALDRGNSAFKGDCRSRWTQLMYRYFKLHGMRYIILGSSQLMTPKLSTRSQVRHTNRSAQHQFKRPQVKFRLPSSFLRQLGSIVRHSTLLFNRPVPPLFFTLPTPSPASLDHLGGSRRH